MAKKYPEITLRLDTKELEKLRHVLPARAEAGLKKTALLIEGYAVAEAPAQTDNLQNSGTTSFTGSGFLTEARVTFAAPYAAYVHEGTGIYGPEQRRIEPKDAKALAFYIGEKLVFTRSVKGQKGQPFLKKAFEHHGPFLIRRILE